MRLLSVLLAGALATACVPSPGPFFLAEVDGLVLDDDSGAPIAGAEVIAWYRGVGRSDASRPVYHARWATTDDVGGFHFDRSIAPSLRMWLLKTYAPSYAFFHPRYGLQRGAASAEERIALRGRLSRREQALADLRPYCSGEIDDAGARRLAEIACPTRPARPAADR